MTLRELQRECAHRRAEYAQARQVLSTVALLEVRDRRALIGELRDAMLDYYRVHGALHGRLRQQRQRLH